MGEVVNIRAQPGPQEAFLATRADICFYGGNAGGGKSFALTVDPLRYVGIKGYSAIVFRRTSPELTGGGSLWEEMSGIYPATGARGREGNDLDWKWPSGAAVQLRHMQHEKDRKAHQGKQYCGIYFDEVTHFTEAQFWYLFSRNRSVCGVRPYIRATCNPEPDSWVRDLVDWWIDDDGYAIPGRSGVLRYFLRVDDTIVWGDTAGELEERYPHMTTDLANDNGEYPAPTSFTFIPSKLSDNPALENADPSYRAKLMAMPRVERERLLGKDDRGANWDIRPAAGLYFQRQWFEVVDAVPSDVVHWCRGWDLAATKVTEASPDPDYTASVRMGLRRDGSVIISHMSELRGSPGEVESALVKTASQDGSGTSVGLWQDPAATGKADAQRKVGLLRGYRARTVLASKDKTTYAGPLSAQAEAGNVALLRGPWNERFFSVFEAFPDGAHDDHVDAASRAYMELTNKAAAWLANMQAAAKSGAA